MCIPQTSLQPNLSIAYLGHIFLIISIISFFSYRYYKKKIINPIIPLIGTILFYISSYFLKEYLYSNPLYSPFFFILTISSLIGKNLSENDKRYYYISFIISFFMLDIYFNEKILLDMISSYFNIYFILTSLYGMIILILSITPSIFLFKKEKNKYLKLILIILTTILFYFFIIAFFSFTAGC